MPLCRLLLMYFERFRPILCSVLWKEKAPGQYVMGMGHIARISCQWEGTN